jgi:glycolate oxidase FAD binding subunit
MIPMVDDSQNLRERVLAAGANGYGLNITGSGSKPTFGANPPALVKPTAALDMRGHRGIISYDPAELVLVARAGTPLTMIESLLAEHGQMLGFEPPHFGPEATLGGTVACGFSGPRRPFTGAVRDAVLGCRMINGQGEILAFGGQVIKNVAGFDLSRLMVGAHGTLGVLLDVSLRVLPRPECERTLVVSMTASEALSAMNRWQGQSWPLSGLAHDGSWTYIRLAGHEKAVARAQAGLGGEWAADGAGFWQRLKEHQSRFFRYPALGGSLWRLSLAPATPVLNLSGEWVYDWGGALRWLRSDEPADAVFQAAASVGGHALRFFGGGASEPWFQPLSPGLRRLQDALRRSFDPGAIFNPVHFRLDI